MKPPPGVVGKLDLGKLDGQGVSMQTVLDDQGSFVVDAQIADESSSMQRTIKHF